MRESGAGRLADLRAGSGPALSAAAGIDVVAVAVFALLLVRPDQRRLVPILAPLLLLPTFAIVPVVGRLGAIGVELKKRDSGAEAAAALENRSA